MKSNKKEVVRFCGFDTVRNTRMLVRCNDGESKPEIEVLPLDKEFYMKCKDGVCKCSVFGVNYITVVGTKLPQPIVLWKLDGKRCAMTTVGDSEGNPAISRTTMGKVYIDSECKIELSLDKIEPCRLDVLELMNRYHNEKYNKATMDNIVSECRYDNGHEVVKLVGWRIALKGMVLGVDTTELSFELIYGADKEPKIYCREVDNVNVFFSKEEAEKRLLQLRRGI